MEIKHGQIITLENGDTVKVSLKLVKPKFKVGDWVIGWHTKNPNYKNKEWKICDIDSDGYIYPKNKSGHNCRAKHLRLATEEEIKTANVFPDGTPCLVRDSKKSSWLFYYANGTGQFYVNGKKSGDTTSWMYSMKLDINNLPVNE